MRRKKTTKTAKTKKSATRKTIKTVKQSPALKMEKEFRSMPAKIAAAYRADSNGLKQIESKFKKELNNAQKLQKSILAKISKLNQSAENKMTQKQLVSTRKAETLNAKTINELQAKIIQIQNKKNALDISQAKYIALGKLLVQFDKELQQAAKNEIRAKEQTPSQSDDVNPIDDVETMVENELA